MSKRVRIPLPVKPGSFVREYKQNLTVEELLAIKHEWDAAWGGLEFAPPLVVLDGGSRLMVEAGE